MIEESINIFGSTEQDVTYTFEYDSFGKPTTVKVGSQPLSTNVYDSDRQQKLRKVVYGNGQYTENNYDEFGRLIATRSGIIPENTEPSETETTTETTEPIAWDYEYSHAANGQVARMKDNVLSRVVWTEFDEANRPKKSTTQDAETGELIYQTTLGYDNLEYVSELKENVAGTTYTTTYAYDWDDRATQVQYDSADQRVRYTYDGQGRLATRRIINGDADQTTTFSYLQSNVPIPYLDTISSTNLVQSISQPGVSFSYGYAADTNNIVSETRTGGSYAGTTTYEYDSIGQLKRVNSPAENATWVYTYDLGGNILSKKKYAYTEGELGEAQQTITYTYDADWKDQLATYDGQPLEHDEIGNLLNDGTWTYTWTRGRQLAGMSKLDGSTSISYEYNAAGLRTKKTVNGVETKYTLNGKNVVHMTKGTNWMHFYYDAQGKPSIVNYNGTMYHYLYNLQGDVIGIIDSAGSLMVEYNYDAWGMPLAVTGALSDTLGWLNPFRYRGYVYDEETGLYYLRSRYYNPEWDRFINADVLLGKYGVLLGHNLFVYCKNSPSERRDSNGYTDHNSTHAIQNVVKISFSEKHGKFSASMVVNTTMIFIPLEYIENELEPLIGNEVLDLITSELFGDITDPLVWMEFIIKELGKKYLISSSLKNELLKNLSYLNLASATSDMIDLFLKVDHYKELISAWDQAIEKQSGIVIIEETFTTSDGQITANSCAEWSDYIKYYNEYY